MTCKDVGLRLSAYLDEELTTQEQGQLDEHLASCAACRRKRDALLALQAAVRIAGEVQISERFDARLERGLASVRSQDRSQRWRTALMAASAAAAAVLVALGLISTWELQPSPGKPAETSLIVPIHDRPCLHCAPLPSQAPWIADRPCASRLSCGPMAIAADAH